MKRGMGLIVALFLVALCSLAPGLAWADSDWYETAAPVSESEMTELQKQVEQTSAAYDEATAAVEALQVQIDENQKTLTQVRRELDAQKDDSAAAMRLMYKMRRNGYGLVDLLVNAEDIGTFIDNWEYLDSIERHNYNLIEHYSQLKATYEETEAELSRQKAEADQRQKDAADALSAAEAAREEAQNRAAKAAQEEASKLAGAGVIDNSVDWSVGRDAFVETWTQRIDAYLAGTPMAGTGRAFAEAAWQYGVDPRWSPAITNTESSNGVHIPGGYNAWGWTDGKGGYRTFSSWEDGARQHVAYLARSYGYTITVSHAQKYCPPNYEWWYSNTLANMQKI